MHTNQNTPNHQGVIVVLGAGMVSAPLIEHLTQHFHHSVVLTSMVQAELTAAKQKFPQIETMCFNAATDHEMLTNAVSRANNVVMSMLPPAAHVTVAKECISQRKHLVTAGYTSPEMRQLDSAAKDSGVVLLNEMGLDPGMDHMSAMKEIDAFVGGGGRVVAFSSVCGGLPDVPSADNPLKYKFSWSPRGVLLASKSAAKYLSNSKLVEVDGNALLGTATPTQIGEFDLECLPNRNALAYADFYGIQQFATSVFRGTLRFRGFSAKLYGLELLGLLDETPNPLLHASNDQQITWDVVMAQLGIASPEDIRTHLKGMNLPNPCDIEGTIECVEWLGLLAKSPPLVVEKRGNVMDCFCAVLEKRLTFGEGQTDLIVMQHKFDVEFDNGTRNETHTSTLIARGVPGGSTAMASTVGITAAVGAHLIVTGRLTTPGIVLPTSKDVYEFALPLLAQAGYVFAHQKL